MKALLLHFLIVAHAAAANAPARDEQTVVLDEVAVKNLRIETVEADEGIFEKTLLVPGQIDHTCESHSVLSSRIPGRVVEVGIHEGEFAEQGQILARVESRQAGNPPPVVDLVSPGSGLVVRSDVHLGAPVEPDQALMEIHDLTTVWAVARVPQHQAGILNKDLRARIVVPAVDPEPRTASFLRLGVSGEPDAGHVEAIFELPNPGNRLRPGMRAEFSLIVSQRQGVMSVPRESLQGDHASRVVFIKDYELPHTFVRVPVTVGEIAEDRVEILSGLLPGDEVVTRGAYALAFAGKGNASLKEALDAAHGHPHNEDGSEMTKEQAREQSGSRDHDRHPTDPLTLFLALACAFLLLLLIASAFFFRRRAPHA